MSRTANITYAEVSLGAAAAYAVAVGIPVGIIPNPFFIRMIPAGPLLATYIIPLRESVCSLQGQMTAGEFLSYLALGWPICNKVVVLLLGIGGALDYFQPLQPVLGAVSVVLLGYALWLRLRPVILGYQAAQSSRQSSG